MPNFQSGPIRQQANCDDSLGQRYPSGMDSHRGVPSSARTSLGRYAGPAGFRCGDSEARAQHRSSSPWLTVESVNRDLLRQPPPVPGYTPKPWWKSTLIPVTDAEGDMICVDTDPALGPRRGQVIWHVHDDGLTDAIADSYRSRSASFSASASVFQSARVLPRGNLSVSEQNA